MRRCNRVLRDILILEYWLATGATFRDIAQRFGVTYTVVRNTLRRYMRDGSKYVVPSRINQMTD